MGGIFFIYFDKIILKSMWMNKQMKPAEESFKMKSDEEMLDLTFLILKLCYSHTKEKLKARSMGRASN